ncbi:MAG: Ig-like domain-containing protein [Thermoplasmata archaeon]
MRKILRGSVVLWASAFMVLSTMAVLGSAAAEDAADEGSAEGRVATPAPQWKVGDFWRYSYSGRSQQWSQTVMFQTQGGQQVEGQCIYSGTIDHYEYFRVDDVSDPIWYKVSMVSETWQNGTYYFTVQGQQSTSGPYNFWTKITSVGPIKTRKTDLGEGPYNTQLESTNQYGWTSWGKWLNYTGTGNHVYTYSSGSGTALPWYAFPMDVSKTWSIQGTEVDDYTETYTTTEPNDEGQYLTTTFDITETYYFSQNRMSGSTGASYETQTTPAGSFDDSFRITLQGFYDGTATGTITRTGYPPRNVNENYQNMYFSTTRWYSNTAGNIVNYNSTSSTTGLLLTSHHYTPIPPNYQPKPQTVAGQQYVPNMPLLVREDEQTAIEITVLDEDAGDGLNWTVEVKGAPTNPAGAVLMDNPPTFSSPNPTSGDFNRIHTNKLLIKPKQPKTNDRDEYTIMVNVDDGKDGGSINITFRVRVLNVNDKPEVVKPVPEVWIKENSTMTCTTWKMTDIFKDPDLEAGIIEERLSFSAVVTSGPQLDISIEDSTGLITFTVPDYAFVPNPPSSWESNVKFTATDAGCGNPANKTSNSTTGKIKIEHVNHDPVLSANGTELLEEGLSWAEDTVDTRLDLNKVFKDYDTTYAGDSLTFSFSGNKYISVKNSGGKITLTPERDWNGRETIKFKATDTYGRSKELRLECNVLPVNDPPSFCETEMEILWEDEEALTIKEATGPTGTLNKLLLEISVKDPDAGDTHSCSWYVNDSRGDVVYKSPRPVAGDDDYEFKCSWTGPFSASGSPYEVKVVVIDQKGATATYIWNVTVINVNRLPSIRVDSPPDNKSYMKGSKVEFSAWAQDPDEPDIEGLTFTWTSSKQGLLKQDRGQLGAQFTLKNLKAGTHIITLRVTDSDGGESQVTFTVKVREPSSTPGFEVAILVAAVSAGVLLVGIGRRR